MEPETIRAIVANAIDEKLLNNWLFYVLIAVASGAAGFAGAYLKTKAMNLATSEDFDKIIKQQSDMEEALSTIKNDIETGAWIKKEYNAIRRLKLEQLYIIIRDLPHKMHKEIQKKIYGLPVESDRSPFDEGVMIIQLYFPELKFNCLAPLLRFAARYTAILTDGLYEVGQTGRYIQIGGEITDRLDELSNDMTPFITEFCQQSEALMQDLFNTDTTPGQQQP